MWNIYENKSDIDKKKHNYIQYLKKLKLRKNGKYAFVDLISRGTTQAALEAIFFDKLEGLYLTQYIKNDGFQNNMRIHSLYKETQITNMYFTESCNLILETFLSSMEPSIQEIGEDGKLIFQDEFRTDIQLDMIRGVQQAICNYFEIYSKLCGMKPCNKELMRTIWKLRKKADMEIIRQVIKDMKIEDSLNGDKIFFESQL